MKFDTTAVNNSMTMCLLLLLVGATTLCRYGVVVEGHFIWADTDNTDEGNYQDVFVEFSEKAGVPDPLARILPPGMTMEYYGIGATHQGQEDHIPLTLSEDSSYLNGLLPRHAKYNTGSAYVYGTLDYGKFENFNDLLYPFATQIYGFDSEADYEGFFRPLLKTIPTPTIAMKNCGGSSSTGKTDSYKFDIGGFPEGTVNVCIYQQGGLELGCGEFVPTTTTEQQEFGQKETMTSIDRRRQLRHPAHDDDKSSTKSLVLSIDSMMVLKQQQHQQGSTISSSSSPVLLYALANSTTTDEASGKQNIIFASTSVHFQGLCTTKL